jgi:hypothetical protein
MEQAHTKYEYERVSVLYGAIRTHFSEDETRSNSELRESVRKRACLGINLEILKKVNIYYHTNICEVQE